MITGPGGQGKTRLARHLTDTLRRKSWVTGHLRSNLTDHDTPPDPTSLTTALPLLLVVDYAETRPRLLRRLITHLHTTRHRVRLLPAVPDHGWTALAGTVLPADDLTHPRYDNALTLQMTALVALLQHVPQPPLPAPRPRRSCWNTRNAYGRTVPTPSNSAWTPPPAS
ncbi:hypothetical protein ACFCX3_29265 [Streptomyces virginiae]|uniref:hypothetical protein n=1 Tax=Streptomyces virginiae TaxID=1961 RepID=UPI0035D72840